MQSSTSLQGARAYRRLLKAANETSLLCGIGHPTGLSDYVAQRFRTVAQNNKVKRPPRRLLAKQVSMVDSYIASLKVAPESEALTSIVQVLAAGIGSPAYRRALEKGFVDFIEFRDQQHERAEVDEEQTSERQNRLMQVAMRPHIQALSRLHEAVRRGDLAAAAVSAKASVSTHVVYGGECAAVLEVDEEFNKQTVYVVMMDGEGGMEGIDGAQDPEAIETTTVAELRDSVFNAEWYQHACRLVAALEEETPFHRSRGTVISGFGIGGAVGLGIGFDILAKGHNVRNVVTFGSPKLVESTSNRYVEDLAPIRVALAGDPLTLYPTASANGQPFRHAGEMLLLNEAWEDVDGAGEPRSIDDAVNSASATARGVRSEGASNSGGMKLLDYVAAMEDDEVPLTYAVGDEE